VRGHARADIIATPLVIGNLFRPSCESGDLSSLANRLPSPRAGCSGSRTACGPFLPPGEDVAQERSALPEVALPSSPEIPGSEEDPLSDDMMIAVDSHKASNTAAVPGPVTRH
jgi:hypothetical protein